VIIETGTLSRQSLRGWVVVVTGAGGGIGFEAARALLWLGARVVTAEIGREKGRQAAARLCEEWGADAAIAVHTDVGDERSVARLARRAKRTYGKVDAVINNATVAPLGAVQDVPVQDWDRSYRVNLRGPVLLARAFVPEMVARNSGAFLCVSSVGLAYMSAYESLKAAQVHLSSTLDTELEDTGVSVFTIAPGFVPTETALSSIPRLAEMMGKPVDELREILREHTLSIEAAGAGFAAAVVLAERYRGQEIASVQALHDAGIEISVGEAAPAEVVLAPAEWTELAARCAAVRTTLVEQSRGWQERNLFERQWMVRTFRQYAQMPVAEWVAALARMQEAAEAQDARGLSAIRAPLQALAGYYAHLHKMAEGYLKDPAQREEYLGIVYDWRMDVERLAELLASGERQEP